MKAKINQGLNLAAINFLEHVSNEPPDQDQISLTEQMLLNVVLKREYFLKHRLTRQEVICVLLAAKGATSIETARYLKIKKSTVDTYRKEIMRKLQCNNMAQALFELIQYVYLTQGRLPTVV